VTVRALTGAVVIDGTGRPPIHDAVVLIADGRIVNVFRNGDIEIPSGADTVDLTGKWLVPGLIDSHVHAGPVVAATDFPVDDPATFADHFMRDFLKFGVTTVRDTGSPDVGASFQKLKSRPRGWPRFFGSGPNLDGVPGAPWAGLQALDGVDAAREAAAALIESGVDFLKVYVWMTSAQIEAVVDEAHRRGVRVASHAGHVTTVEQAVLAGVDALEHLRAGPELISAERRRELESSAREWDWLFSFRPWREVEPDSPACDRLIGLLVERGVWITPTLVVIATVLLGKEPWVVNPDGIEEMPAGVRAQWLNDAYFKDYTEDDFEWARIEFERQLKFLGRAYRAGVKVAAGTDTPNPFVLPGRSLHVEMELLVKAGLTPLETIRCATLAGAELLGRSHELGSIEKAKIADIIALDADPLADIRNSRAIDRVIFEGEFVSAAPVAATRKQS
jgi:imidazolonepropionase-like amidohydrolase